MGCNHQSCVPVGPFAGESWHFEYFPTTTVRQLLIFDHDCHCCPYLLLYTKFHQNWFTRSASRRPSLLNCRSAVARPVVRQQPLPWQPYFGGHVGNVMECDQPSFVPIGQLLGELRYLQYFPTWRPSAFLNVKNFNI